MTDARSPGAVLLVLALLSLPLRAEQQEQPPSEVTPLRVKHAASHLPPPPPPAPALPPIQPHLVEHGPRELRKVALTFDACSTLKPSHYDAKVTRVLEETQTPATLFVGGLWALEFSEQLRALAESPLFEIANHTWSHPHLPKVSETRVREELLRTQAAVFAVTGQQPRLFRPPFGEYDDKVVRVAASLGLKTIQYDLASGDPDKQVTKAKLVAWVLHKAQPGSIVVMHANQRGWHTAEALPEIIRGLRKKGFQLVTVGELLRDEELRQHDEAVAAMSRKRAPSSAQGPCPQFGVRGAMAGIDW